MITNDLRWLRKGLSFPETFATISSILDGWMVLVWAGLESGTSIWVALDRLRFVRCFVVLFTNVVYQQKSGYEENLKKKKGKEGEC